MNEYLNAITQHYIKSSSKESKLEIQNIQKYFEGNLKLQGLTIHVQNTQRHKEISNFTIKSSSAKSPLH